MFVLKCYLFGLNGSGRSPPYKFNTGPPLRQRPINNTAINQHVQEALFRRIFSVDIVSKYWNQLETWVLESYELIRESEMRENSLAFT